MTRRILLLDLGNSRLKWAVVDAALIKPGEHDGRLSESAPWLGQGAAAYDGLDALPALWQQWGTLSQCYAISVVSDATVSVIQDLMPGLDLKPAWLKACASTCGVRNNYHPPEGLGADRWAALIAARHRTHDAALVISAGSALTVDALHADGQFLGGIIVPGWQTMRRALAHSTAQLGMQYGNVRAFPTTTADAVESGIMAACLGAIATMRGYLEKHAGATPRIFLTGGDAASLAPFLSSGFNRVPGLVLEGVYYMSLGDGPT
jgi:type III pantothenate kinase